MSYQPDSLRTLSLLALIFALAGCTASRPGASGSSNALYDYESFFLHPEFRLYHHSDDSTTLYFRIHSEELLYIKPESTGEFEAGLNLTIELFPTSGSQPADTLRFTLRDFKSDDAPRVLEGQKTFALKEGLWVMNIQVTDMHRGVTQGYQMTSDKSSRYTAHNYLMRRKKDGTVLYHSFPAAGDTLLVESARNVGTGNTYELALIWLEEEPRLPPPPFSSNSPEVPDLSSGIRRIISPDSGYFQIVLKEGLYFGSLDPERRTGFFLSPSDKWHPEVRSFDQLVRPLRYITSKAEFDEISKNNFPKKLVDNFWVECGGSKDRARELIRIYYGRVEEANRYFSSYTEGWRTDRGMIHLIFGNPSRIRRAEQSETWIYGEEGSPGSTVFVFRKLSSSLSDNIYVLQRDPMFRQVWEQMVTIWRQGRVFGE